VGRALVALGLAVMTLSPRVLLAADARQAVEAFVTRLAGARISDLAIRQTFTLYDPEGRAAQSTGEQQVFIKIPERQRVEQTVDGRREVRLTVDDRMWLRRPDGTVVESEVDRQRSRMYLFTPFRKSAADLRAEWRRLGIRDDVTQVVPARGRLITIIGAAAGDRTSPAVWLDERDGVVRLVTREQLADGPRLLDVALSEHRPLEGGFPFPFLQEFFTDGKLRLRITVRSARANGNLPDELFDPDALRRER
jgi:hypothetical protein